MLLCNHPQEVTDTDVAPCSHLDEDPADSNTAVLLKLLAAIQINGAAVGPKTACSGKICGWAVRLSIWAIRAIAACRNVACATVGCTGFGFSRIRGITVGGG